MEDDIIGILFGVALLVATVFLVIAAGTVIFFAAIPAGIGYTIYWHKVRSPAAQEQQAKERTLALYHTVQRQFKAVDVPQIFLDRITIEDETNHDILFRMASRLVAYENLDDYPPKPPELCDTIEGGRYRDFLNSVSPDTYKERIEHIAQLANLCSMPPANENIATIVRRQGFWDQWLPKLKESLAHLVGLIMRRAGGDASVSLRVFFV